MVCAHEASAVTVDKRREERRDAIIDAAETLFLEKGFERVSLSAIIARSGGSMATVYELFGNKQGLLYAVVERGRARGLDDLDGLVCEIESPREALLTIARLLHDHLTTQHSIAMMRVVIVEAMRDPEFARTFHSDVHLAFVREIAACMHRWNEAGLTCFDDPDAAAELFLATVVCDAQLKAMKGVDESPMDAKGMEWRLAPFLAHYCVE